MVRLLGCCLIAGASIAAAAEPLPVEHFFKRAQFLEATLSPDGRSIARIIRVRDHDGLAIIDLAQRADRAIAHFNDGDVLEYHWINARRLLFAVGERYEASADARFFGWWAVNVDGTELQPLNLPGTSKTTSSIRFAYLGPDPAGGDEVIVALRWRSKSADVYRYHTKTGDMTLLTPEHPASYVTRWMVDRDAVPRIAWSYLEGVTTIWYRDGEGKPWIKLAQGGDGQIHLFPLAFDFDNRTLYVAWTGRDDKKAIHRYDFEKREVGERLARHLDVDMDTLVFSRQKRKLMGFAYNAEKSGVVWVDEDAARLQQMLDRALPGQFVTFTLAANSGGRVLVRTYSDFGRSDYYLFDTEKNQLARIGTSHPWIKPEEMSPRTFVRYKARDGLAIPAWLTIPKPSSGKNLPLVVIIHGGPWIPKQSWIFNPEAQFFASRGYAVLQPDYRGTTGYGRRHYGASFGQWGYAMQDDITDGVEWLIRDGVVDKDRVCLYGGSYGGYAALWGLMKTPALYRCAVAGFAVTDIEQLYDDRDRSEGVLDLYKQRIGDLETDRDKFRKVSPLYQVQSLNAPVLLVFGATDPRVRIRYAMSFRSALDRAGKKYDWVVYSDEGHGLNKDENRFDFYRRIDAFLQQHLAPTAPAKLQ